MFSNVHCNGTGVEEYEKLSSKTDLCTCQLLVFFYEGNHSAAFSNATFLTPLAIVPFNGILPLFQEHSLIPSMALVSCFLQQFQEDLLIRRSRQRRPRRKWEGLEPIFGSIFQNLVNFQPQPIFISMAQFSSSQQIFHDDPVCGRALEQLCACCCQLNQFLRPEPTLVVGEGTCDNMPSERARVSISQ